MAFEGIKKFKNLERPRFADEEYLPLLRRNPHFDKFEEELRTTVNIV